MYCGKLHYINFVRRLVSWHYQVQYHYKEILFSAGVALSPLTQPTEVLVYLNYKYQLYL